MNKKIFRTCTLLLCLSLCSSLSFSQTTKTVGITNADYATLKDAFDAINAGSISGAITLQIIDNTIETASAVLNASSSPSNYTSVTIYPTMTGKTISGSLNVSLIDLNGADNVIIDGRVNATGTAKDLTITNTSIGSNAATIRFYGSAENNTIKYCTVKGSETSTSKGILFFDGASTGNGNDNNTVDNNNITSDVAGRPINAIYSKGSNGFENNNITISNNNIYDVLSKGTSSYMIRFEVYTTASTISGNSLYESSTFVPTADVEYNAIRFNNTNNGNNITITDNYIGGSSASCGGTAWTKTNAYNNKFYAIFLNVTNSSVGNENSVQNNTIKNFAWSNSGAADWAGIYIAAGSVKIGNTTANTIGATSGTGSITISGGTTGTNVYGIYFSSTGTITCQNNTIGSITAANSNSTYASNFYGILRASSATTNISNNLIGSTSTANSIQTTSASNSNDQSIIGIKNTGGGTLIINNNTIANLTNATSNTSPSAIGLINGIASGYGIITNNTIYDLTNANANTASDYTASVCGIVATNTGSGKTITGNTIYNLSNTYTSFAGSVIGLFISNNTSSSAISRNFIHSLSVDIASNSATLYGININTVGSASFFNNIINLGGTTASTIYGICDGGASSQACNIYFNTIYIGGSLSSGISNKSYCLYGVSSSNTRNYSNNIFMNARSTISGSSLHYGAYFNFAVNNALTLNYNDYYITGTGGVLGFFNSTDVNSLPLITGMDANSLAINPLFASAGGLLAADYIPATATLAGTTVGTVSADYASNNRAGTPTMGAYEGSLNLNIDVYKAGIYQSGYSSLKEAFSKINSGFHTGALEIRIKANTTETSSAILYRSGYTGAGGTSNYTSIRIYPTVTGITISGNIDAHLIDLDGADNVIIDGRVNEAGTTKDMTISNTSVGSSTASTIRFYGSAENNIVKYCTIKGSGTSSARGIIYFAQSINGNGNDGNTIENNNITSSASGRPFNVIYSAGISGYENNNNIISNNNIYDFLRPNSISNGINIYSWSSDWTISGNSLYETSILNPTGAFAYTAINVSTLNKNMVIGNYIGGSEPLCGGSALTIIASYPHSIRCVSVSGGSTAETAITIQNNIIRNINYTSTSANPWDGIYIRSGNVNIIGNTIGATTGNGSIIVSATTASARCTLSAGVVTSLTMNGGGSGYNTIPVITFSAPPTGGTAPTASATISAGEVTVSLISGGSGYTSTPVVYFDGVGSYSTSHCINNYSAGVVSIINNNIGSITTMGSTTFSHGIESIYLSGAAGTYNVSNNLIGSLSTANSIHASTSGVSSLQKQDVYGIYSAGTNTTIITGNTVANLSNGYTGINTGSRTKGINTSGGSNTITNNIVRNISTSSAQSGTASNASLVGISQISTSAGKMQIISGNNIYDLSNTNATSARVDIYGIYYAGPTTGSHDVSGNFVHSLSISTSNTGSDMDGIVINSGGIVTCANNIINLGVGVTSGYKINGIWDGTTSGNTVNFYFNSIYIGGIVSSGITSITTALNNANNTSTRNYRNNIFYNARTGGSTGKHYAIVLSGVAGLTIDYNDYFFAGTVLGKIGTLEKSTLSLWKTGTSQDVNSLNINPVFILPGGTSSLNYYCSSVLQGVSETGISVDFDELSRGATPQMGALETNGYTWYGSVSSNFGTPGNWSGGIVPPNGADIFFASLPNNDCVLDQNRILGDINNDHPTYKLVVNGKQLTITGNLTFTNGALIDATNTSSNVVFAGTAAQIIPTSIFLSNTLDSLTINNSSGVTLNGNLTIAQALNLNNGSFSIGANALTINGSISKNTGSLIGGASSNIIFGGSGASTILPAVSLNNLTLNRSNGIVLNGSVNIAGTLALTNGTLTVGANILTISGSSPTRISGNIDASNANATLFFNNPTAIILPQAIFAGNVNHLTIHNTGGITVSDDIHVEGILNLQSTNPSTTKGLLDMWDGALMKTLTMGADATTIGIGDVTGIVRRTSFIANVVYTFGNSFTTVTFPNTGTLPTEWKFKIEIGNTPSWKTEAIQRTYDIIRTGGTGSHPTIKLHYLDSEINSNNETNLVFFGYLISNTTITEYGRINGDETDNWISLSGSIDFAPENFNERKWTLSSSELPSFTWLGTVPGQETDWNANMNWSGGNVPNSSSDVHIPAGCLNYPVLPSSAIINSLTIESGATVFGGTSTSLSINGGNAAWYNRGTFIPETSTIIFTNIDATMSGETNFYNLTINSGAGLTLTTNNIMRIAGSLSNSGSLDATVFPNTVEYNGDNQSIINPNGATIGYYHLLLNGTGTKTLPASALSILGDFTISGTTTVNAAAIITILGDFFIHSGSSFNTNAFTHSIAKNFNNNGTFNANSANTITMNGDASQTINGASLTVFNNLIINNSNGVTLLADIIINNNLTLTNGNLIIGSTTLGINGTINKSNGFINGSSLSSLIFGGADAITINNNLFPVTPSLNNLTINRSGGVTLGNQDMNINGTLNLTSGTLNLGANTLIIAGNSPTRTSGNIDVSNSSATIAFTNTNAITLPASIFNGNVSNLIINGIGGVIASSDFSIIGILNLQSENSYDNKGSLDMGAYTLTMEANATTIGLGDVTGIIKRTTLNPLITYTFGNQFTTVFFPNEGILPTEISAKIKIGTEPSWKAGTITREIEIIQTGASHASPTKAILSCHYLDTELNGNDEEHLVFWIQSGPTEYGRSGYNTVNNYVTISNVDLAFYPTDWDAETFNGTLDEYSTTSTLVWNGSTSDSWTSAANWTPNVGPSSDKNIIIPDASTTNKSPTLPSFTEIKSLTIDAAGILNSVSDAQLTINGSNSAWSNDGGTFNAGTSTVIFTNTSAICSGTTTFNNVTIGVGKSLLISNNSIMQIIGTITNSGSLSINGTLIIEPNGIGFSDGSLINNNGVNGIVLQSNETSSASLIHNNTNVQATVQRWVSGKQFVVISPPVIDQNIHDFILNQNNTISYNSTLDVYALQQYNESSGWSAYFSASTSGDFEIGKAYSLRIKNTGIVTFKGTLQNSNISKTITRNSFGWNGIGNPFTSSIDVTATVNGFLEINKSQLDDQYAGLWVYDPSLPGYQILNNVPVEDQDYLALAQGFIVKSKVGGGTLSFNANSRSSTNAPFLKNGETQNVWHSVKLKVSNGSISKNTLIAFNQDMTRDIDVTYDAGLFQADTFMLFSRMPDGINDLNLSIQALPNYNFNELIIPLGCVYKSGGNITFSASYLNLPSYLKPLLEDKELGITTDLSTLNYSVNIPLHADSIGRFFLHIQDSRILYDVFFTSSIGGTIKAEVEGINFLSNTKIEKGKNIVFKALPDLGFQVAEWTVNDSILQNFIESDFIYSDLKSFLDVKVKFIETASSIDNINSHVEVFAYVLNNHIFIKGPIPINTHVELYDILGRRIMVELLNESETNSFNISEFKRGIYVLNIVGNNMRISRKLIIY